MSELLTAAQMRAIESAAIESGDVTGLELMERAGQGVVDAIFEEWPELNEADRRAVVLCGPGNNGGDGFVVARLLKELGWTVEVFLYGDAEKLPPDAKANFEKWNEQGSVEPLEDKKFDKWPDEQSKVSLLIDALFGTGLTRPLKGFECLRRTLNFCSAFAEPGDPLPIVVAVDVPSGLCADSGRWLGSKMPIKFAGAANMTVTFHSPKTGHMLSYGPENCGKLVEVDIGLSRTKVAGSLSRKALIDLAGDRPLGRFIVSALQQDALPETKKIAREHKYTHGHALCLSGGFGKTGAARLAARGALRIGAGLVTLGVPGSAQMEVASQITALMLKRVDNAGDLEEVLQDRRINALCLGPGLGLDRARALVPVAVRAERTPYVVLDADALTAFAEAPEDLFAILHSGCVLTPHGGEFARLFPDIAEKLNATPTTGPAYSKVDATREAAKRAGCTVLFKGPDTVIAAPDGRCRVNAAAYERAAPWLATAGSGDVLAGFITGLLARGIAPMQAAETAAWLHVECARQFGPGLIAEDLPDQLPAVFRALAV